MKVVAGSRAAAPACVLLLCWLPVPVAAHDVDVTGVARVFLDETGDGTYRLSIVDRLVAPITDVQRVLPMRCAAVEPAATGVRAAPGFSFDCGSPLTVDDTLVLPWALEGVVVLARWQDGSAASAYFRGDGRVVTVSLGDLRAGAGSRSRLAGRYFVLGGEHILFGIDHLLFVAGLLLVAAGPWLLVKTITAFTVAHSITLGAAVLGLVPVANAPVEAAIALSIMLLAREIVVGRRGGVGLVRQRPWLVAFVFGLLHGFGFAGALGEIGLRRADIPMALLSFNLGVEAGQLLFVAALLVVRQASRALQWRVPRLEPALGYALGAVATLWFLERLPGVWGGA